MKLSDYKPDENNDTASEVEVLNLNWGSKAYKRMQFSKVQMKCNNVKTKSLVQNE